MCGAQSTAPGTHHVVIGERCVRSCRSHAALVDPFHRKECISGHLKTVDNQYIHHLYLTLECGLAITLKCEHAVNS